MLCPKCGYDNPDNASQCSKCNYKFRFGHAYKDPQNMTFISSSNSKKPKIVRYVFFSMFLLILILIVVSWLKSI